MTKRIRRIKRRKVKWKNVLILIFVLVCLYILIISSNKIFSWYGENSKTTDKMKEINEIVTVETIKNNENTEIINQEEKIPKSNPYWDYIKMDLINVNFSELKKVNSGTVGWIQVGGTNINYPFVQAKNNEYYLNHSFDKTYNQAGWVFLDYRNNTKYTDKNIIIYAHSRLNNTMFGTLKNTLKSEWLNNTDNHIVKLSTETENTLWQVFSIYHIKETSDYIKINFNNNEEFSNFTDMLIKRSAYDFKTTVSTSDKILTLSTCYKEDERMVLHAKLIKKEKK